MAANDELLESVKTRLSINLHPSKLASVLEGVQEHLNGLLLQYNEDLEGVPLAYSDEHVVSTAAMVHPYFPLTQLTVSASIILFRPKQGARVTGIVNKLGEGYIGMVVLGFMNSVVRVQDVRADIRPRQFGGSWTSARNPEHTISVGDTVAFTVLKVEHSGTYVTLSGALVNANTGNVAVVGLTAAEAESKKKKEKKRRKEKESKNKDKSKSKDKEAGLAGGSIAPAGGVVSGGREDGNGIGGAAAAPQPQAAEKKRKQRKVLADEPVSHERKNKKIKEGKSKQKKEDKEKEKKRKKSG